jgi:hypothetical protein
VTATFDQVARVAHFTVRAEGTPIEADAATSTPASPAPDVLRTIITYTDGSGTWKSLDLTRNAQGTWSGSLPSMAPLTYFVQAVDTAGNVGQADNKGLFYSVGP